MRLRRALLLTAPLLSGGALFLSIPPGPPMGFAVAQTAPLNSPDKASLNGDIIPILQKYCFACHGPNKRTAGVGLHVYKDEASVQRDRKMWEEAIKQVRSGAMPPTSAKERPSKAEIDLLTGWATHVLGKFDCNSQAMRDPGRVTIRRLNRVEYNNTVRDLFYGMDLQPAKDFPSDDVGYGFDNIGDVLTIAPLLMEKYIGSAEKIVNQAIVANEPPKPTKTKLSVEDLKAGNLPLYEGRARELKAGMELASEFAATADGDYLVRVRAGSLRDNAKAEPPAKAKDKTKTPSPTPTEPVRLGIRVDGKEVRTLDVPVLAPNFAAYEARVTVKAGRHKLSAVFPTGKVSGAERRLLIESVEIEGPVSVTPRPPTPAQRRIFGARGARNLKTWARDIITTFATRAFRRPVEEQEVDRLMKIFELTEKQGDSFEKGVQLMMQAVLVSPHFLFRVEPDRPATMSNGAYALNDYELATRLSYFLWSSMPDDTLFNLAAKGQLKANLETEVKRMLRDPKSRALVENFADQWLTTRNLQNVSPDPKLFPAFTPELRADMATETDMFFEAVMREDLSVLEFLDGNFTFLNERLAKHYGIPGVSGPHFRRVTLTDGKRGGVLTHASILTITSNPTRTSPVKRGKWILEQLLGTPPPPPPPGADSLDEADKKVLSGTLRQKMEQHRVRPDCFSCHSKMDPLGFGLENFDAVGVWRTKEGNNPIDSSGVLPDGSSFKTPAELRAILKGKKDLFVRNLAEKMLTYALGRGTEHYDRCAVDRIYEAMSRNNFKFSTLVLEIARSEPFQLRRAKGATR